MTTAERTRACARKELDPHADPATRAATCLLCWLAIHDPDPQVRAKLGGGEWVPPTVPKPGTPKAAPVTLDLTQYNTSYVPPAPAALPGRPPCRHEGGVINFSCCRGDAGHVRYCEHPAEPEWDQCTRGKNNGSVQSCLNCSLYEPAPGAVDLVFNQGAGGLGDGLLGLLAVARVKEENPYHRIVYRVGKVPFPFVRLFGGYDELRIHEWDEHGGKDMKRLFPAERQLNDGYNLELRSKGEVPRWVRYLRNAGATGGPIVPPLRDQGRVASLGRDYEGCIILCPFSAFTDREWPQHLWLQVEEELYKLKLRPVILHTDEVRPKFYLSEKVIGASPDRVTGIMLNAACVIGLDSGLTHLAGLLGRPTVALCGQTRGEQIFGAYRGPNGGPNVTTLYGPMNCNGCYWHPPHHHIKCRPHCPSMRQIPVGRVVEEVRRKIGGPCP